MRAALVSLALLVAVSAAAESGDDAAPDSNAESMAEAITGGEAADAAKCTEPAQAASTAPAKSVRVLVLELTTQGGFESSLRSLSQVVAEEASRVPGYDIVSTEEIRSMLDAEAQKQLVGCDESGCLAEIAGALDADLLISGQVDPAPDRAPVLTLSLMNTRAVVTVNRVALPWRGDPGLLPEVARTATQRLVFEKSARAPGAVVVENMPPDATILIDEQDRTKDANAGRVADLEVGPHEVTVLASGYEPATRYVVVTSKKDVSVDGSLESSPVWTSWWFWGVSGAAVVTAVAGTVLAVALTSRTEVTVTEPVDAPGLADVETVKGLGATP